MSHIMIVDDQAFVNEFLSEDLAAEGHRVTCVETSDGLREGIRASRPDIVLLDLFLDGFEGWDLLRELKRDQPMLPVLIVSAYESFRDDPRAAAADGYVVKDFHTQKLKEKIQEVLKQKEIT